MSDRVLEAMRDVIQEDVGQRGLRTDPAENLITACPDDFEAACRSIAEHHNPNVCVVTGFFIPHGEPPACETDGPLGALFLVQALGVLRIPVHLIADPSLLKALEAGLEAGSVPGRSIRTTTAPIGAGPYDVDLLKMLFFAPGGVCSHVIALERVGPSHTLASVRAQPGATPEAIELFEESVPASDHDRCHSMRGRDITEFTGPAHLLFEHAATVYPPITTIGIGDGGNEIGMGTIPWAVIQRNIPRGGLVACRVPTDLLIVCGVSNWGAYALAAGVLRLRGVRPGPDLFNAERQREILRVMVERGPLVDGVTGKPTVTVDGLSFERYIEPLNRLAALVHEG
jgi:hypothetical protein